MTSSFSTPSGHFSLSNHLLNSLCLHVPDFTYIILFLSFLCTHHQFNFLYFTYVSIRFIAHVTIIFFACLKYFSLSILLGISSIVLHAKYILLSDWLSQIWKVINCNFSVVHLICPGLLHALCHLQLFLTHISAHNAHIKMQA